MSTEVASARLPRELLRELDREASARGISRSVYLAEVIESRGGHPARVSADPEVQALIASLTVQMREMRESHRSLAQGLRDVQATLRADWGASVAETGSPLLQRLTFSTFFSEALIKRISALLYRHPGELGQVVQEAREQAEAESKLWHRRLQSSGSENEKGVA